MAEVHPLHEPRRKLITDSDGSALRATWHNEAGFVVLSLWRGDTCVATSHLNPKEAARLASFITSGLGDLVGDAMAADVGLALASRSRLRDRFRRGLISWRDSVGWSLERIGHRLRSKL